MKDDYPKTWAEMSFEFKGMFAYHLSMLVMMFLGKALSSTDQVLVAGGVAGTVAIVSLVRRIRAGWRWQGVGIAQVLGAMLMAALMVYFLGAVGGFSLERVIGLGPWSLAVVGIGVFSILRILRFVHFSDKSFLTECGDQAAAEPARPPEPRWKKIVGYVFTAAFLAVWLEGVTSFYIFDRTFRSGSPTPTAEKTEVLTNHGVKSYVTPDEKHLVDQMMGFMMIGIPAAVLTALFLRFVLKIKPGAFGSD